MLGFILFVFMGAILGAVVKRKPLSYIIFWAFVIFWFGDRVYGLRSDLYYAATNDDCGGRLSCSIAARGRNVFMAFTNSDERIIFPELAEVRFGIPNKYFSSVGACNGPMTECWSGNSLLLEVFWLTMRPGNHFLHMWQSQAEQNSWGDIYLAPSHARYTNKLIDFNSWFDGYISHLTSFEFLDQQYGLDRYRLTRGTKSSDFFLERDGSGKILTTIECGIDDPFPGCNQTFLDGPFIYTISYRRAEFLPHWQEQRQKAIDLIRSFVRSNSTYSKE